MNDWLKCKIKTGQFSGEYAVQGTMFNSQDFSLFVNKEAVKLTDIPNREVPIDGLISVEVLEAKGELVLVSLPGPSFENGQTITVKKEQMQLG